MAASFKIPKSLKRKGKKHPELPKFDWKLFQKEKKLGCGAFGSVYLGKYEGKMVTKKIMSNPLTRNPVSLKKPHS
jgi:hypothetical protein